MGKQRGEELPSSIDGGHIPKGFRCDGLPASNTRDEVPEVNQRTEACAVKDLIEELILIDLTARRHIDYWLLPFGSAIVELRSLGNASLKV